MSAGTTRFLRPGKIKVKLGNAKSKDLALKPGDRVKIVMLNTNFNITTSNSKKV